MSERLSLRIRNDVQEIDRMGREVGEWCRLHALPDEVEYQIDLVLDELVSNVIRHGLKDNNEHIISVEVRQDSQELVLEVEDDGVPFNPLDLPAPDINQPIEERRVGGLGIFLVREIMDSLAYERRDGRNHLLMKKLLQQADQQ